VRSLLLLKTKRDSLAIYALQTEERRVALKETVEACLRIVSPCERAQDDLRSAVLRTALIARCDRSIIRPADEGSAVVVIKRRDGQQKLGVESMHPREVEKGITLALNVADE